MRRHLIIQTLSLCTTTVLTLSACAGAGALTGSSGETVSIAMVSNAQMTDAIKLSSTFEAENPDVHLQFITLPENQARAKITVSTVNRLRTVRCGDDQQLRNPAVGRQWLAHRPGPYIANTPGYDANDFIPSLRESCPRTGTCTPCRSTASRRF